MFSDFVLQGRRVDSFAEGSILNQNQDGLKQPIFSPELLGNIGGAISPAQNEVEMCHQRSRVSQCRAAMAFIGSGELARG